MFRNVQGNQIALNNNKEVQKVNLILNDQNPCIDFDRVKPEHRKIAENFKCPLCIGLAVSPITCETCNRIIGSKCLKKWLERGVNCPISGCEVFKRAKTSPIIISTLDEFELTCKSSSCKKVLNHENFYTHKCKEDVVIDENDEFITKESQLINTSYLNKIVRQYNSEKNVTIVNKLEKVKVDQQPKQNIREIPTSTNKKSYSETINSAVNLIKNGNITQAIELCEKALSNDPKNYKIPYKIGNSLLENKNPELAMKLYYQSLAIEPNQKKIYFNIGNALSDLGKYQEANEQYNLAILLDPNYNQAYSNLGLSLMSLGKNKEAEECFMKAIMINPSHKQAYNNLAVSQLNQKKFSEAAESCIRALDIDPNYKQSIENLDIIMKKQDKFRKKSNLIK